MPEACSSPCIAEAGAIEVLAYGSAVAFFRSDLAPRPGDQETGPPALFMRRQRRDGHNPDLQEGRLRSNRAAAFYGAHVSEGATWKCLSLCLATFALSMGWSWR